MKELRKIHLILLGTGALISTLAFSALLLHGGTLFVCAAAIFIVSAWASMQNVWWLVVEISGDRIDEKGNLTRLTAKRWTFFLHHLHLWSFFSGMALCVVAVVHGAITAS